MLYGELRVVLPEEWENRTVYTFTAPGNEGEMMPGMPLKQSVTVMKLDLSPEVSLEKIALGLFASTTSPHARLIEHEPPASCRVGNLNAWRRRVSVESPVLSIEQIQCVVEAGTHAYAFTFVGRHPLSGDRRQWFEQFLADLKFAL